MKLHFNTYGQAGLPLIILHGFLGTADNWHTQAQKFALHRLVIVPDLRNHGRSPHSEEHSMQLMVDDVLELMAHLKVDHADLLGHSMGGKVAMNLALQHPDKVRKLIVADMSPRAYKPGHEQVFRALFAASPPDFENRREVEDAMTPFVPEASVRQFLMKNLSRDGRGHFIWKMNLPALHRHYEEILKAVIAGSFPKPTLFIRGELSDYIHENELPEIRKSFPLATIVTVKAAGHWIHAEQAGNFYTEAENFLAS